MLSVAAPRKRVFNATIDRIEEDHVVLELERKVFLTIPLGYMPEDVEEGEHIRITCEREKEETESRKRDAKDLLNDILHSS